LVTDAQILALLDAIYEHARTMRVSEFVDADLVMSLIDRVAEPSRLAKVMARFAPGRARVIAWLGKSERLLETWLPEKVRTTLADFLGRPMKLPKPVIDELVLSERVRDAVRTAIQESVSSITQRAFRAAPGGKRLQGVLGLAAGAGRLLGGIGDDLVDGGVALAQSRLAQRLATEETAVAMGVRSRAVFLELMSRKDSELGRVLAAAPWELIEGLVPLLVEHNLARPEVRELVRGEIAAALADLSTQTIGELLDELGLGDLLRETLRVCGLPFVRSLVDSGAMLRAFAAAT
jgi:hypothetical protein